MPIAAPPELQAALARVAGPAAVIAAPEALAALETDITGRWRGRALAAVAPADAATVAAVLAVCRERRVGVVVQGGNTGLVGGAVPQDEVVMLARNLTGLDPVDRIAGQVTVGAGETLERVQAHVRAEGLDFAVDLAARTAATVGGMAATNAGGALAVRYGTMAGSVAGLEAVLGDGRTVTRLAGLSKDTAGYDIPRLLVGSEGTLAVITRLRLRLIRRPPGRLAALVGFPTTAAALAATVALRDAFGPALEAADVLDASGIELVRAHRRLPSPLPEPSARVLVVRLAAEATEPLLAPLDRVLTRSGAEAIAIADATSEIERLWLYREAVNESIGARGVVHKLDISVPLDRLVAFEADVRRRIAELAPAAILTVYGHLGDGNLHINMLGLAPEDETVDRAVAELVAAHGGSISAEHGIGVAKRELLALTRTADEIAAMRAVKGALDPDGTLGRGRVLPAG